LWKNLGICIFPVAKVVISAGTWVWDLHSAGCGGACRTTPAGPTIPKIGSKVKDDWDTLSSNPEVNWMRGCRKTSGSVTRRHLESDLPAVICNPRAWVKNSGTCAAPPPHEMMPDKVDSGVIGYGESDGGIPKLIA